MDLVIVLASLLLLRRMRASGRVSPIARQQTRPSIPLVMYRKRSDTQPTPTRTFSARKSVRVYVVSRRTKGDKKTFHRNAKSTAAWNVGQCLSHGESYIRRIRRKVDRHVVDSRSRRRKSGPGAWATRHWSREGGPSAVHAREKTSAFQSLGSRAV